LATVPGVVTKPLAIVFYEKLLPGSRLPFRLADLGWRVSEVKLANQVIPEVRSQMPIVVLMELALRTGDTCPVISEIRRDPVVRHIPVLGYCDPKNTKLCEAALAAGASLVAAEAGLLEQLPHLLNHVLAVE
jgi:CheY-like chemotaxis protein